MSVDEWRDMWVVLLSLDEKNEVKASALRGWSHWT
jgi:hypothetical protein